MRFEFLKTHKGEFGPIRKACELMRVSKSGYYEYVHRRKSNAQIEREALEGFVADIFERHHARYGYRRINQELRRTGIFVSEKRVLHIMRRLGLVAKGATRKHSIQKRVEPGDPRLNLVERVFAVNERNRLWVGDITYVPTSEGWLYLAAVIDAFSRKVVGWSMSDRITEKVAIDAIEQAVGRERPPDDGSLVFHDDQGAQYTSKAFRRCLDSHGITQSASRARNAVGQCSRRILLQDAKEGAGEGQGLQNEGGGQAGYLQIHRAVLQRGSHAFDARLCLARRIRAKMRVRELKFCSSLSFPLHRSSLYLGRIFVSTPTLTIIDVITQ